MYNIKKLEKKDLIYIDTFIDTLNNLVETNNIQQQKAKKILEKINKQNGHIFIALNHEIGIIGSITLLIEQKFIRGCQKAGHIEDVVVHKNYGGMGIGKELLKTAINFSKNKGCYKIVLDCDDKIIGFYEQQGFKKSGSFMKLYL